MPKHLDLVPMEVAPLARVEAERHRANTKVWYERRLAVVVCEMALEEQLCQDGRSSRQISGRRSWFNRQTQGQTVDGVLLLTQPQLVQQRYNGVQSDVRLLQRLFAQPTPPNDYDWIYSDQVGRMEDPARHQVEQRIALLLVGSLAPRLQLRNSNDFVHRAVTITGGNLYRDFILLMWPLLTDSDRLSFQQWYQGSSAPPPAMDAPAATTEPSSSSGLRR
ncbi:unnamed protein product [Symbiodinium sp. KB8]|nr:unnamed protein product [Symbiodinium sp. KB8]